VSLIPTQPNIRPVKQRVLRVARDARKLARLTLGVRARAPREVQLEVTNRCNLDCDMCPRLTLLKVPEQDMSPETFEAVLGRLEAPESITLTGWGEPLMHPRLFDYIDRIHARFPGAAIGFTTNGHLLTDGIVTKILARPIGRVNISLEELPWAPETAPESAPEAPAGATAPAGDAGKKNPLKGHDNTVARDGHPTPPKVVEHLRRFLERRNAQAARGEPAPEVRLQVVLFPGSGRIVERLVDFAADLGFQAVNVVRLDVRGRPDLARPTWEEERHLIALARARAEARGVPLGSVNDHGVLLRLASHADRFCMRLDNYIYVDVHGNVAPCCLLRSVRTGNLVEQTLDEVWNGEAMRAFYAPGGHPACRGCDAFMNGYADADEQATSTAIGPGPAPAPTTEAIKGTA
jgi:MoaA/NifB/PqqE/SkfB family radical SAM enzyme